MLNILLLLYNTDKNSLSNFYKINKNTYNIYHTYKRLLKRRHIYYILSKHKYTQQQINILIHVYPNILNIIIETLQNDFLNEDNYWYLLNLLENKKDYDIYTVIKNDNFEELFDKKSRLILYPLTRRYFSICNRHFNNNYTLYYKWLEDNYIWPGKKKYYKALHGRINF